MLLFKTQLQLHEPWLILNKWSPLRVWLMKPKPTERFGKYNFRPKYLPSLSLPLIIITFSPPIQKLQTLSEFRVSIRSLFFSDNQILETLIFESGIVLLLVSTLDHVSELPLNLSLISVNPRWSIIFFFVPIYNFGASDSLFPIITWSVWFWYDYLKIARELLFRNYRADLALISCEIKRYRFVLGGLNWICSTRFLDNHIEHRNILLRLMFICH